MIAFDHPGWLVGLPLAALPLLRGMRDVSAPHPWLALVPRDAPSAVLAFLLRVAAALAIAATVLALAGPHTGETRVERIGRGAEIVIALDRSRSMDESFTRRRNAGGYQPPPNGVPDESKAAAARRIVAHFVRERSEDAFAVVLFSAYPLPILPFTQKQAVVLAAIEASGIGRGLGNTDIGRAMLAAAENFDDRPYLGSRAVLLISDGGAQLDTEMRTRLATALKRNHIAVYWIYLRGANGRPLVLDGSASAEEIAAFEEQSLHDYFSKLALPYRVYQAERPAEVQKAIDDLGHVEQRPIQYSERLPREDLVPVAALVALVSLALVLVARLLTVTRPQR